MTDARYQILVCRGPTCGGKRNSRAVHEEVCALVSSYGLQDRIEVGWQSCFGRCTRGPNALVRERVASTERLFALASLPVSRGGVSAFYCRLRPSDVTDIIHDHVLRGTIVERLVERPEARSSPTSPPPTAPAGGGPGASGETAVGSVPGGRGGGYSQE